MTVGVPQAPWEYSLRWAAWLAHRQIEKGWLEVHLDIKKRGNYRLLVDSGVAWPCPESFSLPHPTPQKNSPFKEMRAFSVLNLDTTFPSSIPSCLRSSWGNVMATRLLFRKEFHPLGPQFHFCTIPALPNLIWTIKTLNFMILFRHCIFGLASRRAVSPGVVSGP